MNDKSNICAPSNRSYLVKPAEVMFSSYAGTISSTDDFYVTSKNLMITETTLDVIDVNAYKNSKDPLRYIPNFMRVNSATMFSGSAKHWMNQMCEYNTGTYSSQWIAIDYNIFNKIKGMN